MRSILSLDSSRAAQFNGHVRGAEQDASCPSANQRWTISLASRTGVDTSKGPVGISLWKDKGGFIPELIRRIQEVGD